MAEYLLTLTGVAEVVVEADSIQDARQKFNPATVDWDSVDIDFIEKLPTDEISAEEDSIEHELETKYL